MLWYNSKHQTLILGPSNLKIPPICRNLRRDWLVKCHLSLILNKPDNPPHLQKSANWRKGRKGLLSAVILLFLNLILLTVLLKCVKHKTHIQMSCLRNTQLKPKSPPNSCWQNMLHSNRSSHRIPWASSQNKLLPNSPPKIPGLNIWKIGPARTRITLRKLRDGWQPAKPTRQSRPSYSSWLMQTEALPERKLILGTSTGLSTWRCFCCIHPKCNHPICGWLWVSN